MNVHRRLKIFLCLFFVILLVMTARLAYIQLYGGEELTAAAVKQQRIRLDGIDSRGTIYDRNGTPLTGGYREYVYIIKKELLDERARRLLADAEAGRLSGYSDTYSIFAANRYADIPAKALSEDYDAYVMELNRRYQSAQTAAHIIGYVNPLDEKGVSGIELMCDDILSQQGTRMYAVANARGEIIRGYGVTKVSAGEMSHVITTIDAGLQSFCESELSKSEYDGAVVVLQSDTGEILAAASTPTFNPNSPAAYTQSTHNELFNKAIQGQYPPGSIFKLVVAAAALEYGITDAEGHEINMKTRFYCHGRESLYGVTIGCKTGGDDGHGSISLRSAMAQSCNCAFVQLGAMVGGERILRMAHAFGLGENPYPELSEAAEGNLTELENTMWAGIGNLSIGQGELLVTPLQAARMVNIIANDGVDVGVKLIRDNDTASGIHEAKHRDTQAVATHGTMRVVSSKTAAYLDEMLKEVMKTGTGRRTQGWENKSGSVLKDSGLQYDYISVAGKTGSAEASDADSELVHGWFTGYFTIGDSAYTIAVFMENGQSGRSAALPIFSAIFDYICGEE